MRRPFFFCRPGVYCIQASSGQIGAKEGTVKNIGYADPRFRAKSGRLDNAFALAGYGAAPRGREVAFAFIVNVPAGKVTDRRHSKGMVVRMISHGAFPWSLRLWAWYSDWDSNSLLDLETD